MKTAKCKNCNRRTRVGDALPHTPIRCGGCGQYLDLTAHNRASIIITAVSLFLACVGIAISVVGSFTQPDPPAAEQSAGGQ